MRLFVYVSLCSTHHAYGVIGTTLGLSDTTATLLPGELITHLCGGNLAAASLRSFERLVKSAISLGPFLEFRFTTLPRLEYMC
jgi:hypothetical protein